jgi:hypothetical protein
MLRILIDRTGAVHSGVLLDLEGRSQGHFSGWDGLTRRLRQWLCHTAGANDTDA